MINKNKILLSFLLLIIFVFTTQIYAAGGIEITSGGKIVVSDAGTINIADGGFTNNGGTFTAGSGTMTMSGTTDATIGGTASTTFNTLTLSSTGIISVDYTVNASTLNVNPNAKLTLNSEKSLTVTTFAIKSDATGTGTYVDNGTSNFTTQTVEQYLTGTGEGSPIGRGYYVSSPVESAQSSVFSASGGNGLWSYSESGNAYTEITENNRALNPMQGYAVRVGANAAVTYSGRLLNNGTIENLTLSRTGTTNVKRGYHLIGNPYPSYLDWETATKTNLMTSIWYRTYSTGNAMIFDTYNTADGIGTNSNGNGAVTRYIPPMQAVWVKVDADGNTGALTFNNTMRSHVSGGFLRNADATTQQILRLRVSNGINNDEAIILVNEMASDVFDSYDSPKMSNENVEIPEIYTFAGSEKVAINGMNNIAPFKELVLGFKTGKSGTFTINATEIKNFDSENSIFIKDKLLDKLQNLVEKPVYEFSSDIANTENRFVLYMAKNVTEISKIIFEPSVTIYKNANNQINVIIDGIAKCDGKLSVYNTLGQEIISTKITSQTTVLNSSFNSGIYLVSVNIDGKKTVRKIVINNF